VATQALTAAGGKAAGRQCAGMVCRGTIQGAAQAATHSGRAAVRRRCFRLGESKTPACTPWMASWGVEERGPELTIGGLL
jgi:hypothetical protein